jgi:CheY-like chemotaxis protein
MPAEHHASFSRKESFMADAADFPDLSGLTILVVDDHADSLHVMAHMLEACRAAVRTASSGVEALERLEYETPDAVVTDLSMPGMDGVELVHRIKSRPEMRHVRVIALTAFHEQYLHGASRFDAFFRKPGDLDVVCSTILELTATQRPGRA